MLKYITYTLESVIKYNTYIRSIFEYLYVYAKLLLAYMS